MYLHCFFVSVAGNLVAVESPISADLGGSVELSCELYGYLRNGSSLAISWQFNSVPVDPSLIQEQSGTHMIQNGGASPIMSVISVVTLENLTSTMFGTYFCKYSESSDVITLEEIGELLLYSLMAPSNCLCMHTPYLHVLSCLVLRSKCWYHAVNALGRLKQRRFSSTKHFHHKLHRL